MHRIRFRSIEIEYPHVNNSKISTFFLPAIPRVPPHRPSITLSAHPTGTAYTVLNYGG